MSLLKYTEKRLDAFLHEIGRLTTSEFPYPQSQEALKILEQVFNRHQSSLKQLDEGREKDVVKQRCTVIIIELVIYLPLLGFILRSTNVRNAFEVYGPTLRLARALLEPKSDPKQRRIRLILSSEWVYSPYVLYDITYLPGFALIGLPAPESSNPFLVPLSGHELGHLVWRVNEMKSEIEKKIIDKIVENIQARWAKYQKTFPLPEITPKEVRSNIFHVPNWQQAVDWALKQAEESFCDFVGLGIFGVSFLRAFAYLISPNLSLRRSVYYPNMKDRAANLLRAAEKYELEIPEHYESLFDDAELQQMTEADKFRLPLADAALQGVVEELIDKAKNIVDSSELEKPSKEEQDRIYERLKKVVLAEDCKTLPDILNAAWKAYEDPNVWRDTPHLRKNKDSILKNIVLKNIEVFGFEQILSKSQ